MAKKKSSVSSVSSSVKAKPARKAITFTLNDTPGHVVKLAGTFNDWQPVRELSDKNGDGVYRCRLMLEPGEYQYKFLVDGQWRSDCENPNFVVNEFGSFNSVIIVEK